MDITIEVILEFMLELANKMVETIRKVLANNGPSKHEAGYG